MVEEAEYPGPLRLTAIVVALVFTTFLVYLPFLRNYVPRSLKAFADLIILDPCRPSWIWYVLRFHLQIARHMREN